MYRFLNRTNVPGILLSESSSSSSASGGGTAHSSSSSSVSSSHGRQAVQTVHSSSHNNGGNYSRVSHKAGVTFTEEVPGPVTICTAQPMRAPGKFFFEVRLPVKGAKTAIGWMGENPPDTRYMTPDYIPSFASSSGARSGSAGGGEGGSSTYVSFGGAGFIYPSRLATGKTYKEGDVVRTELDFDANQVSFWVDGKHAGAVPWSGPAFAYPALSCEGGATVQCDVAFE